MVVRAAIANVPSERIAQSGQRAGVAGTITPALGFGAWGTEPTNVVESAVSDPAAIEAWLAGLLASAGETAAYVTYDGLTPTLLYADGHKVRAA